MDALTICQPYAEMIRLGEKPIENRTWSTRFRGDLAIHAGKSRSWLDPDDKTDYPGMVFGAVVAVAELYDCVHVDALPAHLAGHEHANGPYCLLLRNVRRIEPVPCSGALGFWSVPADVERIIRQRLLASTHNGSAKVGANDLAGDPSAVVGLDVNQRPDLQAGAVALGQSQDGLRLGLEPDRVNNASALHEVQDSEVRR